MSTVPAWLMTGWLTLAVTAAKATGMYLITLLGLRLAPRRSLAQWTATDFAAAVAIGAVIGRTAVAQTQSLAVGVVALVSLLSAHAAVTRLRTRHPARRLFEHPVRVLVHHGQVRADQLKRAGVTERDLAARLRQRGHSDLGELRFVLLEPDGRLSVVSETVGDAADGDLVVQGLRDAKWEDDRASH